MATLWDRLISLPTTYLVMWGVLAVLTVGMVALMRTRWGRERPTPRYVLLSVVGHLLLICLATTVRFLSAPLGEPATAPVKVRIVMRSPAAATQPEPVVAPDPVEPVIVEPKPDAPEPASPASIDPQPAEPKPVTPEPAALEPAEPEPVESPATESPAAEQAPPVEPVGSTPSVAESVVADATTEPTPPEPRPVDPASIATPPPVPAPAEPVEATVAAPSPAPSPVAAAAPEWRSGSTQPVNVPAPVTPYGARTVAERWRLVEQDGGSRATEDAVASALAWLASAQANDGRWDADRWAGGRERRVLGEDRRSAGIRADTGVTALALLALMGAGHTHTDGGPYAETTRAGLQFLLHSQSHDGGLAGNATLFAQTYCHSMATFALAEALAHTRDARLERAVRSAVDYLVARQHPATGGWRYRPGQPGDMSQIGWVIMALRSAELGGVEVTPAAWAGIERFVDSVRRGRQGGLACYRRDGPTSRTMTAEALYCRQILGAAIPAPARDEAIAALVGGPPGAGQANLYYWYYATLALHHLREKSGYADTAWQAWNEALTRSLVASQVRDGTNAGSWSPNTLWGGYGGRVYSTAMAAMCLEVYYRYDPQELVRDPWIAARPGSGQLR